MANTRTREPAAQAVFLTPVLPSRAGMGLAMRAGAQLAGLMRNFTVTTALIPLVDSGAPMRSFSAMFPGSRLEQISGSDQADPYFNLICRLEDPAERLFHFERYGKPSLAAAVTSAVAGQVAQCAARCGATHVHAFRSYLLSALDLLPDDLARSVDLDEDDVSSFLSTASVLESMGQTLASKWARLEAIAFDRLLREKLRNIGTVTIANHEDAPALLERHASLTLQALPNGVALPRYGAITPHGPRRDLLFVGSLRYEPNVDGLRWFMSSVLPRLPSTRLLVVGRAPPRQVLADAPHGRVAFLGHVNDLASCYRKVALAIAPMRSGGGTRLKILEAAAHGVPVVATPEAAAGLMNRGCFWGMIASGPHHFAQACRHLIANPHEAQRLGQLGRHVVAETYDISRIEQIWTGLFGKLQKGPK